MGGIDFFVAWELWQQMTFVLACCIVAVFFAGLAKLWWVNRSVRKHEKLDEEKKTRISEMRSTGLPIGKKADIPFGVRAIQSGIEIDGIWISRPGTPNSETPLASYPMGFANESRGKGKTVVYSDSRAPTLAGAELSTANASPTKSTFGHNSSVDPNCTPPRSPALVPQKPHTYRPKNSSVTPATRPTEARANALKQLEGGATERPQLQTYVPGSSFTLIPGPDGNRQSSSSDEGLSQPSLRNTRRKSPFPDVMRSSAAELSHYTPNRYSFEANSAHQRNPFDSPEPSVRDRSVSSASRQATYGQAQTYEPMRTRNETPELVMRAPERSYSGDVHLNRQSRRVNGGFEVLPAGTFGEPADYSLGNGRQSELERGDTNKSNFRFSRPFGKLQNKDRTNSSSRDRG